MALVLLTALNLLNYIDRYVLPGVQPLAVPVDAGTHLIHIRLGLDLRAPEIALLGIEGGFGVAQLRVPLL